MADDKREPDAGASKGDEAALQEELRREAAEGRDSIGDVSKNQNLTGSSTWETLPPDGTGSDDQAGRT